MVEAALTSIRWTPPPQKHRRNSTDKLGKVRLNALDVIECVPPTRIFVLARAFMSEQEMIRASDLIMLRVLIKHDNSFLGLEAIERISRFYGTGRSYRFPHWERSLANISKRCWILRHVLMDFTRRDFSASLKNFELGHLNYLVPRDWTRNQVPSHCSIYRSNVSMRSLVATGCRNFNCLWTLYLHTIRSKNFHTALFAFLRPDYLKCT